MKHIIYFVLFTGLFTVAARAQYTITQYLSGTDKDNTVQWDFYCTKGRNAGNWTKIAVPSQWELEGFGGYSYGWEKPKTDEQGLYKYSFNATKNWQGKKVLLVFEGVMTDAEVKLNGKSAGDIHQGGFYQFKYDISSLLKYDGPNTLEVTVSKQSSDTSVNRAERNGDFWALGGIYRPVYLKILPSTCIDRVAINAKANGDCNVQVFTSNTHHGQIVEAQLQELNGKPVGLPFRVGAADSCVLSQHFPAIRQWNPEEPNLYQLHISIKENGKLLHSIKQRIGFRTAELRVKDGFYVNGVKVLFKGVDRHSAWPESGRTLSRAVHLLDIGLMKDMNMNAVRMSHYPPDQEFLDLCDSLGLFVIDELTGWQAAYDTHVGRKLVKEMVQRDVNHPSIVIWSNGNEGGWNRALDGDFSWYDPQQRLVIHPWEKFNGTDTKHYPDYNYVINSSLYDTCVFFPTEAMHGIYDGGHGAGLEDFWNAMRQHPYGAGMFLWDLADEGIVRTDKNGEIDTYGNAAPDGIVGPHREKEGSYYAIKEIWSPVYFNYKTLPQPFDGSLEVENRYHFTNLDKCFLQWDLVSFPKTGDTIESIFRIKSGTLKFPDIAPGAKGWVHLPPLPPVSADALFLTAYDTNGKGIMTWSWPLHFPAEIANNIPEVSSMSTILVNENENTLAITTDGTSFYFDKQTGFLQKVFNGKKDISLSGGPSLAGANMTLVEFKHYAEGNTHVVEPVYKGDGKFNVRWIFQSGQLPKLEYSYSIKGEADYLGITFKYPEEKINGMRWLGRGPYHVWKNRLKGMLLGAWEKKYNNTITGESWNYPEFKGWHADLYWVTLQNKEADFTIYTENENIFLEMCRPAKPVGMNTDRINPPFPEGNIGFMTAISPIGTKFQAANLLGPQSQKNQQLNYNPIRGTLLFDFR